MALHLGGAATGGWRARREGLELTPDCEEIRGIEIRHLCLIIRRVSPIASLSARRVV